MKSIKREEEIEEKDEYARIRDSKLILALDAFDELDYIYRTTNKSYRIKKKYEQIQQANLALKFPYKSDDSHCHRTFEEKLMVTVSIKYLYFNWVSNAIFFLLFSSKYI